MSNKIVCFETLGCRLNQCETEGAARFFKEAGFICCFSAMSDDFQNTVDVILCVINTCTVTHRAEKNSFYKLRVLANKFPRALILITGCIRDLEKKLPLEVKPQTVVLPGLKKGLLKEIALQIRDGKLLTPDGSLDIFSIRAFVQQNTASVPSDTAPSSATDDAATADVSSVLEDDIATSSLYKAAADDHFSLYTAHFQHASRATLKIQDGCDRECTFCAIRLARGKSISLPPDEVLRRTRQIEDAGYAEVVLTGVNLSLYSGEHEGSVFHLGELLEFLICNTTRIKFRLSSLYPEQITDDFCRVLKNQRVQPFFHLSVQSLNDSVLEMMGRSYHKQDVIDAVARLRECKDNPFISCDIIVGFAKETVVAFRETMQTCQELAFAWIHVFPFSLREGTKAKEFVRLGSVVKKTRVQYLCQIAYAGKVSYIKSCEGRVFDAIVEKIVTRKANNNNIWRALTDNYLHAVFQCDRELQQGSVVRLKIVSPLEESISEDREEECQAELVD